MDLKDNQGTYRQQDFFLVVHRLERVNMLFHTSFLDHYNIPHVLHKKTNNLLKLWLTSLIKHDRTASSSSRISLLGVKFAWPSQMYHRSRNIKIISRLWYSKINH